MTIQLELPQEQVDRLHEIAHARKRDVNEVLAHVITDWLEAEAKRQRGWEVLRELSQGLGESEPPHDAARNHDKYLYGKP